MSKVKEIQRLNGIVKSVNDLVRMKVMQALTREPVVYVLSDVINYKDESYKKNWCQNVMRVWALTFRVQNINSVEFSVFDKESGSLICKYSEKKGVYYEC